MNKDELLKLLDLNSVDLVPVDRANLEIHPAARVAPTSENATVYRMDRWSLRRGMDLLEESERLAKLQLDYYAIADFHTAAFDPDPQTHPDCQDPKRLEFLTQLMETAEYQSLHAVTRLDDPAASIAATAFAESFANLKDEKEETEPSTAIDQEMETLRAVGRALTAAQEEVLECREMQAGLGMGEGLPGSNDPRAIANLYRRVRSNPTLREICALAGRYRRYAQSRQRRKTLHGYDDMVGVELDGDLSRILPSELAKLVIPELELDTLRRLVERQTLCRAYHSTEPVAKGPIIICIDESGSMEGEKAHTAKALGLAIAWIARQQHRWCGLVAYSGDSGERILALPPHRWNETQLMDWLEAFIGGGSSIDVPVREMPRIYRELKAPSGETDLIFLTDAKCRLPDEVQADFMLWKTAVQARLITLVIECEPRDLASISDELHVVQSLALEETGIERVLSI